MNRCGGDAKAERFEYLKKALKTGEYDVICLQEMFASGTSRRKEIINCTFDTCILVFDPGK